ncbi:hypothetical protein ACFVUW_17805 [Streptomyces xiamenensis]|uniref:hypothetical protein n=1 Tax=Streptomyces xiamenensis TaxID=408015 RepID=UPI0036EA2846
MTRHTGARKIANTEIGGMPVRSLGRELRGWARERWISLGVLVMLLAALQSSAAGTAAPGHLARQQPCAGVLNGDEVAALPDGPQTVGQRLSHHPDLGRYTCTLTRAADSGGSVPWLTVQAVVEPDDVEYALREALQDPTRERWLSLPDTLPGVLLEGWRIRPAIVLLLPCPDLGTDAAGRSRSALVRTEYTGSDGTDFLGTRTTDDLLTVALTATRSTAELLGCGASPLPEPTTRIGWNEGGVPVAAAATPCAVIVPELPAEAAPEGWRIREASADAGPASFCEVSAPEGGSLLVNGWFGGWSESLRVALGQWSGVFGLPPAQQRELTADARQAMATATCDGEHALFQVRVHDRDDLFTETEIREVLTAFATDQAQRRGCTGVELPQK